MRAGNLLADGLAALGFFTRLPVPFPERHGRPFAVALWAAPLAGLVVALLGAVVFMLAAAIGLSPVTAALLALAATMLATGCLHEDGLADVADGFGGGKDREGKLLIMRDSRIGSYGVAALVIGIGLRWAALSELEPDSVLLALLAAHAASRGLLPLFLKFTPPARVDGLAAGLSAMPLAVAASALALGSMALLPLGLGPAVVLAVLLALLFLFWRALALRQIGGQTGDVCGALQQSAEIIVLLAATLCLP
ncbi:MAG: adenosylcobinamide-GDP ribazoletransferase [Mesorhizobium amorphae]|nr:MAG: adenosylcobinamide-GDP ribazoletransferase [Mesorhizobium amorphae]